MPQSVESLLLIIISVLIIIVFWWAIYSFFHAIFLFIFSAWDAEKIKKAWNSIRFMILWIFLTLFFLFIFPILFKRLGMPNYEKFEADNIFRHTASLLTGLFNFWKEAVWEYNNNSWTSPFVTPTSPSNNQWGTINWWWWTDWRIEL